MRMFLDFQGMLCFILPLGQFFYFEKALTPQDTG
jgi:hypothetical protein